MYSKNHHELVMNCLVLEGTVPLKLVTPQSALDFGSLTPKHDFPGTSHTPFSSFYTPLQLPYSKTIAACEHHVKALTVSDQYDTLLNQPSIHTVIISALNLTNSNTVQLMLSSISVLYIQSLHPLC